MLAKDLHLLADHRRLTFLGLRQGDPATPRSATWAVGTSEGKWCDEHGFDLD